jgi:hypothetical protein
VWLAGGGTRPDDLAEEELLAVAMGINGASVSIDEILGCNSIREELLDDITVSSVEGVELEGELSITGELSFEALCIEEFPLGDLSGSFIVCGASELLEASAVRGGDDFDDGEGTGTGAGVGFGLDDGVDTISGEFGIVVRAAGGNNGPKFHGHGADGSISGPLGAPPMPPVGFGFAYTVESKPAPSPFGRA